MIKQCIICGKEFRCGEHIKPYIPPNTITCSKHRKENNRRKCLEYRLANPEKIKIKAAREYLRNKESILRRTRQRYLAKREELIKQSNAYAKRQRIKMQAAFALLREMGVQI